MLQFFWRCTCRLHLQVPKSGFWRSDGAVLRGLSSGQVPKSARAERLQELQGVVEAEEFIGVYREIEQRFLGGVHVLLNRWSERLPDVMSSATIWDDMLTERMLYCRQLKHIVEIVNQPVSSDLVKELDTH